MTHANSITFDLAWYTILSQYSASVRRTVCDAVLNFAATGEIPVLKGTAKVAFEFISHEISKQRAIDAPSASTESIAQQALPAQPIKDEQDNAADRVEETAIKDSDELPEATPNTQTTVNQAEKDTETLDVSSLPLSDKHEAEAPAQIIDIPEVTFTKPNPPVSNASPQKAQRGCISRSRQTIRGITCVRKGSKMIFKKR